MNVLAWAFLLLVLWKMTAYCGGAMTSGGFRLGVEHGKYF